MVLLLHQFLYTGAILWDKEGIAVGPSPHQFVVDHEAAADDGASVGVKLNILLVVESLIDLLPGHRENHTLWIFKEISTGSPVQRTEASDDYVFLSPK